MAPSWRKKTLHQSTQMVVAEVLLLELLTLREPEQSALSASSPPSPSPAACITGLHLGCTGELGQGLSPGRGHEDPQEQSTGLGLRGGGAEEGRILRQLQKAKPVLL